MNKKMVVAVDIDDVLYPFSEFFVRYVSNRLGVKKTLDDMVDYKFETLFNVSNETMIDFIKEFMNLQLVTPYLPPIKDSVIGVKQLSKHFDLQIVTARLDIYAPQTQVWIDKCFPNMFSAIHYCGITNFETGSISKITKLEKCREIGAIMLIDDNAGNIANVMSGGDVQGVLFGKYPWHCELPANCEPLRVENWNTVITAMESYLKYYTQG